MRRFALPLSLIAGIAAVITWLAVANAMLAGIGSTVALAQSTTPGSLTNHSQPVATGNTYQQLLAAAVHKSVSIQNNNATDTCEIDPTGTVNGGDTTSTSKTIGGKTLTAIQVSIELLPGQAWTRYYPYIPNNAIVGTCSSSSDSIYVDTQ